MEKGKSLPERYELLIGERFPDATEARSSRRDHVPLQANYEAADTRLILHACDAANRGYERILANRRNTDVMILLVIFMFAKATKVWMISGTTKKRKCYPIH